MTTPQTHLNIHRALCGEPTLLAEGEATVVLTTTEVMVADARGLVHGGFVFGAVDYAAMLAVNDPNVVLGSAEVRFTAPVQLGDVVRCTAHVTEAKGRKRVLAVEAAVGDKVVLAGTLSAFVLDQHVLGQAAGSA